MDGFAAVAVSERSDSDLPLVAERSNDTDGGDSSGKHRQPTSARQQCRRLASPVLLSALLLAVLVLTATHSKAILGGIERGLEWLKSLGPFSPLVVFGLQLLVMLLVLPTWPLWLCVGAAFVLLWGHTTGLAIAFGTLSVGVWLGSVLAFLLGRYALRPCIAEWISRRPLFRAIDAAVETNGLKLGLLLKLSPLMHTSLSNYVLAATRMRFIHFVLSCPGTFLSMTMWIFAGASLSSLSGLDTSAGVQAALSPQMRGLMTAVSVLGCLLAMAVVVVVTRASRRAYAELLAQGANAQGPTSAHYKS
mmetsp:Transcript_15132/g.35176  ORF Transcript_15132/g.35176 Transcript_15132/m.35176 type:complete len:305 (-) Transcript_15132:70-984(-)